MSQEEEEKSAQGEGNLSQIKRPLWSSLTYDEKRNFSGHIIIMLRIFSLQIKENFNNNNTLHPLE